MANKLKFNISSVNFFERDYKIIVVEDDDGLNRLIQKKLQKEGYHTDGALTGKEALLKIGNSQNEILLIDFRLPDMTGKQLTTQLIEKYHNIPPIIVITGFGDEKVAVEMMKLGAWDYIVKEPYFIDILPEKIKHLCEDIEKNIKLKKAEEDLSKNLEVLNDTGDMARIGGWEVDLKNNTVYWTQSTKKIHEVAENYTPTIEEAINFYPQESRAIIDKAIRKAIEKGIAYDLEVPIITAKGNRKWTHSIGKPEMQDGKCIRLRGTFQDITERKKAEDELKKIEWLLQPKKEKPEASIPDYGDLTTINQNGTILYSVGKETLNGIVGDYLSLLETSAAVYEKNGDYAVSILSSEWCQFMDCSSRALCKSKDNKKALESGKWLCHQSCWEDASSQSIQMNKAVDIECSGGLHIYAIPIRANNEVIGSINFGYGNPPTDEDKLIEIAANYNVSVDKLKDLAQRYETRPAFIIDIAKEKLETSAKVIGNIVERNQLEEDLLKNQKRYQKAQEIGNVGNWEYDLKTDIFWGSHETRKIFGFKPDNKEINTDRVENCIPEGIHVHQALIDLIEHDKKYDLIYDILTEDKGIRKTIHSIAEIERDARGNPLKITGVVNDITIQKKADGKLKALNQQLVANEQQLKASNQQLQAGEQQLRAANQQLIASEQQLLASNQQLRANEQQLRAINKSLMVSEKQFRNLFNSMQEGVYLHRLVYDDQGNAVNYHIIEANPISEEYLNIKREEAIGKLATDLYGTEEAPFIDLYAQVAESGEPVSFEQFFEPMKKYFFISVFSPARGEFATVFLDITEKKLAEISLTRANEELNKVQEITHVGIWHMDIATNKVVWSKELYKMYGFDPDLPVPPFTEHKKLFTPDSWEILSTSLARTSEKGIPYELELRTVREDSTNGWMWVRGEALYDENKKIVGLWGAAQDISERKNIEQELIKAKEQAEESERKLIEAQELSHVGNWEYIIDTDKVTWSKELFNIFDRSYDLPAPQYSEQHQYYTEESFALLDKAVQDCVLRDKPYEIELDIITSSGTIKQIISKGRNIKDKNNKIIGSYGTAQDITEKKKIEQELIKAKENAEESEKHFKCLIENAPDAVTINDKEGSIKYASPNAFRHFGYSEDELVGHSGNEFTHPEDLNIVYHAFDTIVRNPTQKATVKYRFRKKDGDYRWIETTFSNLLNDETIKGFVLNFSDITEKKQALEELVIAKEKAEESDRLKSAFLANMSHEIRTPMNGILGFTSLLQVPNLTGEEQHKYIEIIQKSGERMLSTVNDIINISKIESGLVDLSVSEVNINEQLKYLHSFFKPEAAKNGTQLVIKNEISDQDFKINTDPDKLNSILTNLIKNAIKFTSQGSIEMGYSLKNDNGQNYVEFIVKDTGVGIHKNRQTAIFDRFVQADIEDKHAIQGSGLGLAISKAYTEMLGGRMWVNSKVGLGSTFYFTIKYNSQSDLNLNRKNDGQFLNEDNISGKLKILVVEDDETSDMLISIMLEEISREILHAKNGLEAIELCRNNPDLDLILMDIKMPVMDGYETTRQIRQLNKDVIVIAQTAYGLTGDREKAIDAGCNSYISKPINKTELLTLIQKYFK